MSAAEPLPPPTEEEAYTLCKMGQGHDCCRYLAVGPRGWGCLKFTELRSMIDARVASGTMNAQSDNCQGKGMG